MADGTLLASTDQPTPPGPDADASRVNGQQYVWRYQLPGGQRSVLLAYADMVVPVGMTVILDITADDVVHSWWIPKLGGKIDAVPGYHNKTWFQIPPDADPGRARTQVVYNGQCAELCGRNHANMYARVIGVQPAGLQDAGTPTRSQADQARRRPTSRSSRRRCRQQQSEGQTRRPRGPTWQPRSTPPASPDRAPAARRSSPTRAEPEASAAGRRGSRRPITRRSGSCTWPRCSCSSCSAASRRC